MIVREGNIIILKHLVYKRIITIEQNHKANVPNKNLATNSPYFSEFFSLTVVLHFEGLTHRLNQILDYASRFPLGITTAIKPKVNEIWF